MEEAVEALTSGRKLSKGFTAVPNTIVLISEVGTYIGAELDAIVPAGELDGNRVLEL